MELPGFGGGCSIQLPLERLAKLLELLQRLVATEGSGVATHQRDVHPLVGRLTADQPLQRLARPQHRALRGL